MMWAAEDVARDTGRRHGAGASTAGTLSAVFSCSTEQKTRNWRSAIPSGLLLRLVGTVGGGESADSCESGMGAACLSHKSSLAHSRLWGSWTGAPSHEMGARELLAAG